jgi:hypothetical protein
MKSYSQLSEDVYSADYKYNPRTGRKTKAKRIAFNYGDDDKKVEKNDKDAEKDKKNVRESTLLTFSEKMNLAKAKMDEGMYSSDVERAFPNGKASGVKTHAPVAPVPDKKYIKGTPEHKAYKATKKPINGMPTNKEEVELTLEQIQGIRELLGEKLTAQHIKQAIGIARDKRYAGGNMTGAVKAMEKVAKGSSEHKRVQGELKKQNEEVESVEEGWDDMLKAAKERNKPQPNGGAGKKEGSRYGGSKQKDEPVKEELEESDASYAAGKEKEKEKRLTSSDQDKLAKLRAMMAKEKKPMRKEVYESELDEATPTKQQVKQGIGIARDKRYAGGNMTGAVKAMDTVNKGLAQHPAVKKELQKQNEETEEIHERNKENALKRKTMDASRGARFKAQGNHTPDPEPEHKTAQAHNKAVGRAIRQMSNEEIDSTEVKLSYRDFIKEYESNSNN